MRVSRREGRFVSAIAPIGKNDNRTLDIASDPRGRLRSLRRTRPPLRSQTWCSHSRQPARGVRAGTQSRSILDIRREAGEAGKVRRTKNISLKRARVQSLDASVACDSLLFLFLHLAAFRLRLLDNLLLLLTGNNIVMMHFHIETAAALGHGGEVNAVGQHF